MLLSIVFKIRTLTMVSMRFLASHAPRAISTGMDSIGLHRSKRLRLSSTLRKISMHRVLTLKLLRMLYCLPRITTSASVTK